MKRKTRINLIPPELRATQALDLDTLLDKSLFLIFILIFISGIHVLFKLHLQEQSLDALQHSNEDLSKSKQELEDAQLAATTKNKEYKPLQEILRNKIVWSGAFKELSSIIGEGVWLENLQSNSKEQGHVVTISGYATTHENVAGFFSDLEKSYYFRQIIVHFVQRKKEFSPPLYEFEFNATIPDPSPKVATK